MKDDQKSHNNINSDPSEIFKKVYMQGDYETALKSIIPMTKEGNPDAQYFLGLMYFLGNGVEKSDTMAAEYFQQAADDWNHVSAQIKLAGMYKKGQGVEKSDAMAYKYYKSAADQGNAISQYNLVFMIESSLGLCFDNSFGKSSSDFDDYCMDRLDWMMQTDYYSYLKQAADNGYAPAQYRQGLHEEFTEECLEHYWSEYPPELRPQIGIKSLKYFKLAADQGYAAAQYKLGRIYSEVKTVEKSDTKASAYFKLAAENGVAEAQEEPGDMYCSGVAMSSQYDLGRLYYEGKKVEQSYTMALKYYKLAAAGGKKEAQDYLGWMYDDGEGIEQSYINYCRMSADQEDADAHG